MKKQDFTVLKITDLYPFPDNPFRVVEDDMLMELSESIKEFGMVTPIITRPKEDGNGYEIIAGQRRVRASELAGIDTVPAFVLPLDRDRAIITLVAAGFPHRFNFVPTWDEVADRRNGGAGLWRRQDHRTAFYPSDGADTADFAEGGRGKNRPHACSGAVLSEERRAGKSAHHNGERGRNALSVAGAAYEKVKPTRAARYGYHLFHYDGGKGKPERNDQIQCRQD